MSTSNQFDVIIIGGSYSGLSAAMALGRSLRNVLVIDAGSPCNKQTPHSHNFLTQDGKTPAEISLEAKKQVKKYKTVQFHNGFVSDAVRNKKGFSVTTKKGNLFSADKLIIASGIKDLLPDIKGFSECWGISLVHCPYCHGYEYHGKKTALFANGEAAYHYAQLVGNLTKDIHVITNGKPIFLKEHRAKFRKHNVNIIDKEVSHLEHKKGVISNVVFKDGSKENFAAMYYRPEFIHHSEIHKQLGCEETEHGYIKTDGMGKTNIPGVYACGDNSNMMRSVATAVYSGNLAGAMLNKELVDERF